MDLQEVSALSFMESANYASGLCRALQADPGLQCWWLQRTPKMAWMWLGRVFGCRSHSLAEVKGKRIQAETADFHVHVSETECVGHQRVSSFRWSRVALGRSSLVICRPQNPQIIKVIQK